MRTILVGLALLGATVVPAEEGAMTRCCAVVELRQYTLHPGQRDVLIALFEEHFVEGQEQYGYRIIGTFRDLDKPDRFVWLRGFPDMTERTKSLQAFYTSPTWKSHSKEANATMIDSDNVLLLKPAAPEAALPFDAAVPARDGALPSSVVVATVHSFAAPVPESFASWFGQTAVPALARAGTSVLGRFVTEPTPNGFPALPVREGENVFVWLARYADRAAADAAWARAQPALRSGLSAASATERIVLAPTSRSRLR